MSLGDDLKADFGGIFATKFKRRAGREVPEASDIQLGNDAVELDGAVLYADMAGSTRMVDTKEDWFAAKIYKSYLRGACKIIRAHGGVITAFDGDRVMSVFINDRRHTRAAIAGLKINHMVKKVLNPEITRFYGAGTFSVEHCIGIDRSKLFVVRTGIRGSNDLVWVGRAANYAAKLTELSPTYPVRLTGAVFDRLADDAKFSSKGKLMWEERSWTAMNKMRIHRSSWTWAI